MEDMQLVVQQESVNAAAESAADRLLALRGDEEEMQQNRYKAADAYEKARKKAEQTARTVNLSDGGAEYFRSTAIFHEHRRACILWDTDRREEGQEILERTTQVLVDNPYRNVHLLIEAYNRMALFHNNKQNVGKCLDLLHQAEDLYNAWLNSNPTFSDEIEMPDLESKEVLDSPQWPQPDVREEAKDAYGQTLYLLADTYSSTNNTEKATEYCTKTLGLQLEMGVPNYLTWASTCRQLVHNYMEAPEIAVAQHLLNCAEIAVGRARDMPEKQMHISEADVASLWAFWYTSRLHASVLAARSNDYYKSAHKELPELIRFEQLSPPKPETLLWDGGFARTMDEAKQIFNAGMRKYKEALTYYKLGGKLLVAHCNIVMDISQLYRAKRVEALLHELKPQDNPQAYRALQYEIGNAYREITDIKFEEGRSFEKVAASAKEAIPYYEAFLDSFKVNGKLPAKIEDEELCLQFLHGAFYLARVVSRLDPSLTTGYTGQTQNLRKAVELYRFCARFIKENELRGKAEQELAKTCLEMASLVQENAEMLRVAKERHARTMQHPVPSTP